jgi:hypothetical protein
MLPPWLFLFFRSFRDGGTVGSVTWEAKKVCASLEDVIGARISRQRRCTVRERWRDAMLLRAAALLVLYGAETCFCVLDRSCSSWTINVVDYSNWLGRLYFRTGINFWRKLAYHQNIQLELTRTTCSFGRWLMVGADLFWKKITTGRFVPRERYYWLVVDKPKKYQ